MVACKDCGKEISSDSAACPHCGKRRGWGTTDKALGGFFIALFVLGFVFVISSALGSR